MEATAQSDIVRFFEGKCVFLTGVTGFVGKALLEKILRSCVHIEAVYVLIRDKNGKSPAERLAHLLSNSVFDRVRMEAPEMLTKVHIVPGDITAANLGLNEQDAWCLVDLVSIVIHSAASVRFDESLSDAARHNLEGTFHVLEFVSKMKHLQAFVYISTAYSNCNQNRVEERVYETSTTPTEVLKRLSDNHDKELEDPSLLEGRPNGYTMSKALAEQLVYSYKEKLPISIVRPSIVSSACEEPVAGWVEGYNGATGALTFGLHGLLHFLMMPKKTIPLDLIPVDHVVNLIITVAWHLGATGQAGIYNCCSSTKNPISIKRMADLGVLAVSETPFERAVAHPWLLPIHYRPLYPLLDFVFQRIPCEIMDLMTKLRKKEPQMMKKYKSMHVLLKSLDFFIMNDWKFPIGKTERLYNMLSPTDKERFNFSISSLDWKVYMANQVAGIKKFLLRETETDLKSARARFAKLRVIHWITVGFFAMIVIYIVLYIVGGLERCLRPICWE